MRRGLLIPHGFLHTGKKTAKRTLKWVSSSVGGHLIDLKNMDVCQEWKG